MQPTIEQSTNYNKLYTYFNERLFNGQLKPCMLTFSRNKNIIGGYFSPDKWENENGERVHEIAINANIMIESDMRNLCQILIHEMSHLWQFDNGKPTRNGYHNQQWADKVKEIGLLPVNVQDESKETGQAISTSVIEGSAAENAIIELPTDYLWEWQSTEALNIELGDDGEQKEIPAPPQGEPAPPKKNSGKRQKHQCPVCGLSAWTKPGNHRLICADCNQNMVAVV